MFTGGVLAQPTACRLLPGTLPRATAAVIGNGTPLAPAGRPGVASTRAGPD